jgi:hypothetical protein
MTQDIRLSLEETAKILGDFRKISYQDLCDGYHKAKIDGDKRLQSAYLAAVLLREWYMIDRIYQKCKNIVGFEREDAYSQYQDCVMKALEDAAWLKPDKEGKTFTAQQCVNQVLATRGAPAIIYNSNLAKNKGCVSVQSIDDPINDGEDRELTLLDTIEDEHSDIADVDAESFAISLVQKYINKNKVIEAIILDTIASHDFDKTSKNVIREISPEGKQIKRTVEYHEFSRRQCIKYLSDLPQNFSEYFSKKYIVKEPIVEAAVAKVRASNNPKLYKYLDAALNFTRAAIKI